MAREIKSVDVLFTSIAIGIDKIAGSKVEFEREYNKPKKIFERISKHKVPLPAKIAKAMLVTPLVAISTLLAPFANIDEPFRMLGRAKREKN